MMGPMLIPETIHADLVGKNEVVVVFTGKSEVDADRQVRIEIHFDLDNDPLVGAAIRQLTELAEADTHKILVTV